MRTKFLGLFVILVLIISLSIGAFPALAAGPADFVLGPLSITPLSVKPGGPVLITVLVTNNGGTVGTYSAILKVNEVEEAVQIITLGAGDNKTVTFTTSKAVLGTYNVSIADKAGQFTVAVPEPVVIPPVKSTNWPLIFAIIGGVLIFAVILWTVVFHRRPHS